MSKEDKTNEEWKERLIQMCVKANILNREEVVVDLPSLIDFIESEKQKSYEKGRKEELLDILFDCKLVDNDVYNHKLSEEEAYNKLRDLISKSIDKNL